MSTIGRPAYGFIGHILFGTIVAGGMTAAVGMVCALRSEQGLLSSAFPEFLLVFVLAAEGAYAWVHFHQAKAEDRVRLLDSLYAEFDTARARRAREAIYNTPRENLRIAYLHLPEHKKERDLVDSTIASLERLSYRVLKLDVESEDAFQLWGGVMLQVCHKVWPYILEQREQRAASPGAHKLLYRRYLEEVVRKWIPRYGKEIGRKPPPDNLSTMEMLDNQFVTVEKSLYHK